MRSRLFPKTRSWISLGLPLELLSPLAVLRILFALTAVVWPLLILQPGAGGAATDAAVAAAAASAVVWLGLMRVRAVGELPSFLLVLVAVGTAAPVLAVAGRTELRTDDLLLLIPICLMAGLFFSRGRLVVLHAVIAVAVAGACSVRMSWASAAGLALAVTLTSGSATLIVKLLAGSARGHAVVDPDTGLLNGPGLGRRLEADGRSSYVVSVLSLSGMSEVREALGYQVGSELMRRVVEDLGQVLPSGAITGRVEGDELVVCSPLTEVISLDGLAADLVAATDAAVALAEVLLSAFAAGRYLVDDIEITLRAHVGLALAPWDGDEITELVRRAALSARRARTAGQRWRMWAGDSGVLTAEDLSILASLRLAAERDELHLVYQPQFAAGSGDLVAVEALLRWESPVFGSVSPGRFIPLAERTGLIGRLTDWVVGEALDAQVRWRRQGIAVPVGVNLSAKLLNRPDLADEILAQIASRGLLAAVLTIEVTETAATSDMLEAVRLLVPLHDSGVRISIDDFGTGYTSLAILPFLPLDELKVDQGFVMRSATSSADDAIVRSVQDLAHRLGLMVVAEGVEDEECQRRMTSYGFDLLQGYHLARPMPEQVFVARMLTETEDGPRPTPLGS